MKTFKDFTAELRAEIWPSGEAITLRATHTKQFMAAMTDLQKNVPCLQAYNVSTFEKCARYWEDAATVVDQPNGIIRRLFTIANHEWRDKVWLWSSNYHEVQKWQKRLFEGLTPANLGLKALPQGFKFDDGTVDSTIGRARVGIWASYRQRIYVAPWLQSNETLVIEWDGIKYEWSDADGVDTKWWTIDVQEAIKFYVRWQHERHYGDAGLAQAFEADYIKKRADIMLWCWDVLRQQEKQEIPEMGRYLQQEAIDDDTAPTVNNSVVHCFISDWGQKGQPLIDIAAQINQVGPRLILTGGDNVYDDDAQNNPADLFAYFSGLSLKPSFGNHDFSYDADLSAELDLLPSLSGKHYYSVVDGAVQYFLVGNEQAEPDNQYVDANTSTETSIAGQWLKVMLAVSTAKWKVVILPANPWTSDVAHTPGKKWARWPIAAWGADLVLTGDGHNYEETKQDGLLQIECGLGGKNIRAFGANTDADEILFQWNSNFAFLRMTVGCRSYVVDLIDRTGAVIRTTTLTK